MSAAQHQEKPLLFTCGEQRLAAVLTTPAAQAAFEVGVLVVVGGPQYRAGSHRQFVLLARTLAAQGFDVLRFDVRGMGDSEGEPRSFEELDDDIGSAIDAFLQMRPQLRGVVMWGLCDGASAALLYGARRQDSRVLGLCLANPWLRSEATLAQTNIRHYYLRRLAQRDFWAKMARGGVALRALSDLARNLRQALLPGGRRQGGGAVGFANFRQGMALGWRRFSGRILLLISENDQTAQEFMVGASSEADWRGLLALPNVTLARFEAADHTFSVSAHRCAMERTVAQWLLQCAASNRHPSVSGPTS